MKYINTIIFVFIIFTAVISAQTEWYTQNSGTSNFLFDVHFVDLNSGWVCGQGGIILHTSDGGNNWETQDPPPSNYYSGIHFTDDQNGWSVGYAGRIIHTSDGGNNWVLQAMPTQYNISDLYFIDANTGWTVGGKARTFTDPVREILQTTDGGDSWSIQYSGSNEDPLGTVYFVDENNGWAVGSMSTIMQTTNGGNNWSIQMSGTGYEFTDVYFINSDTGWVVGQDLSVQHFAVIFKTIDGGTTWDYQTFGSGDSFTGIQFVNDTEGWVVGGTNTEAIILHTTDGGDNWTPDNPGTSNFLSGVHFLDENNGWAVGFNGTIIHTDNIVPVELSAFTAKVIKDNVKLFWETSTETNNSGFEIQRSDKSGSYRQIGFVPGHGTSLEIQKYSFTDKNVPAGNYSYRLVQLDLDGTRNNSESVKVEIAGSYPYEYKLFQNFPNPFNPTTTIEFSVPEEGNVELAVFNTLGKKVITLVNEYKVPGNYKINFKAEGLSSGIYFYKLQSGNFSSIKKMVLLK